MFLRICCHLHSRWLCIKKCGSNSILTPPSIRVPDELRGKSTNKSCFTSTFNKTKTKGNVVYSAYILRIESSINCFVPDMKTPYLVAYLWIIKVLPPYFFQKLKIFQQWKISLLQPAIGKSQIHVSEEYSKIPILTWLLSSCQLVDYV